MPISLLARNCISHSGTASCTTLSHALKFTRNLATTGQSNRKLLGRYTHIPQTLFRINASAKVVLRDQGAQSEKQRTSYDVCLDAKGLVTPVPDTGMFEGPNGMSVRPNSPMMQEIIRNFRGRNTTVYQLPEGLDLTPMGLICLWEHSDHHSIQTTQPITLRALNQKLSNLCQTYGEKMSKDEFCERYPFESAQLF